MSIFASTWGTDADDHADDCPRWVPCERGTEPEHVPVAYFADGIVAWLDDSRQCTCKAGPLVYQASHILPSDTDGRGGSVDVAEIPGWIFRDGRPPVDPEETYERIWPWLRLWVQTVRDPELPPGHAVVLLDRVQVAELHAYLGGWLERAAPDPPAREGVGSGA